MHAIASAVGLCAACIATLSCGCLAPARYQLHEARALSDRGNHRDALLFYEAALGDTPGGRNENIEEEMRATAWAWARAAAEATPSAAAGEALKAIERARSALLAGYRAGGGRLPPEAEAQLERVVAAQLAAVGQEIEAQAKQQSFVPAVRSGERLAAALPAHAGMRFRLQATRQRAATYHAQLAHLAPQGSYARTFHTCLAASFAPDSHAPTCASLARQAPAGRSPPATAGGTSAVSHVPACAALASALSPRLKNFSGAWAISVHLAQCERRSESETLHEKFSYPEQETHIEWIDEPYYELRLPKQCADRPCERRDPLGVCLRYAESDAKECADPERVLATRRTPVRTTRTVARASEREVQVERDLVMVSGNLRLPSGRVLPLAAKEKREERAFWSPQEARRLDTAPDAASPAVEVLWRQISEAVQQEMRLQAEAARPASGHRVDFELARRHGVTPHEAEELSLGLPIKLASVPTQAPPLSLPHAAPRLRALAPVSAGYSDEGARRLLQDGADLGFTVGPSWLAQGELRTGVRVGLRPGEHRQGALIRLQADSPNLGGDARGFGVDILIRGNGGAGAGNGMTLGMGYAELRGAKNEHYSNLSLPVAYYQGITAWLVLDAELRLNLLKPKDWWFERKGDPHFYSPVSVGLTLVPADLYLEGRATYFIGETPLGDIFFLSAAAGVRL